MYYDIWGLVDAIVRRVCSPPPFLSQTLHVLEKLVRPYGFVGKTVRAGGDNGGKEGGGQPKTKLVVSLLKKQIVSLLIVTD